MVSLLPQATSWVGELERPKEIVCFFEVGANCEDFMNQVLDTDNSKLSKIFFDQRVICNRDALLVNLDIATLIDKLTYTLEVWVSEKWFK